MYYTQKLTFIVSINIVTSSDRLTENGDWFSDSLLKN